ncbi:type II secretion system F family protein [Schlesneria paludicola]|uniref:type II secretion system F family protein n=1 Tax=Schlesneria paludicola TaxID=360056 RepID=UPI00029B1CD6|nr:type II secretion system F family protein [Schlesneria paludicola]
MFEALPMSTLATFCRSLATMLHSGVNILKAFQVAGGKSHHPRLKRISSEIIDQLRKGSEVSTALREQGGAFPDLMVDLVRVADQTGSLPEVLSALADHYDNLVRLRRTFLGAITLPVIQLLAAIFIVAGLIWLLGMIGSMNGTKPFDVLGLGLTGTSGALTWLGGCFGTAFAGAFLYFFFVNGLKGRMVVHQALLRIPVIGGCLQSFALARFSWAFALTQQAGMSINPSLESSLKATGNGAYAAAIPMVTAMVTEGEDLSYALMETKLFPRDYLELVRVGEASGTVPETLDRLSPQLEDQARRSLSAMTTALGWAIWGFVASIIIFFIFRIALMYVGLINDAVNDRF